MNRNTITIALSSNPWYKRNFCKIRSSRLSQTFTLFWLAFKSISQQRETNSWESTAKVRALCVLACWFFLLNAKTTKTKGKDCMKAISFAGIRTGQIKKKKWGSHQSNNGSSSVHRGYLSNVTVIQSDEPTNTPTLPSAELRWKHG